METNARYALIGIFTLVVSVAALFFVYWVHKTGGLNERAVYRVRFQGSVAGLLQGSSVLFDGVRVGEVIDLAFDRTAPRQVTATISVDPATPVRSDTTVAIESRGLTGAPTISLIGGDPAATSLPPASDGPAVLVAGPDAAQDFMAAARTAIVRLDGILADNSQALHQSLGNLSTFTDALARNSGRVDTILAGLERMTGGAAPTAPPPVYDLTPATEFPDIDKRPRGPIVVPEATASLLFDTQKILVRSADGETESAGNGQWSDSLPRLFQAKIVQSFERANYSASVTAPIEGVAADFTLLVDIRDFEVLTSPAPQAVVAFSAKLLGSDKHIVAQRVFHVTMPARDVAVSGAAAALNDAFRKAAAALVFWTAEMT